VNTTKTLTDLSDKNIVDKPVDTRKKVIKEQSTDKEVLKVATETWVDSGPNVIELIILGLIGIGIASSLEEYKRRTVSKNAESPKIKSDEYADYYQDTDSEQRQMDIPHQQTI